MANLYTQVESNTRKTWAYLLFFFVFIISLGWVMSYFLETQAILWVAVVFAIILNIASYWYSDKIVLSMVKARPVKKEDNPELYRLVENLSITAGLPMPKIYIMNEMQPNAFATGRDPEHGVIVVTEGLLNILEKAELEGVLAHELAHIGNRDILLSTVVVVLVGMVVIMTDMFFRIAFFSDGDNKNKGPMIIIALILAILAPLMAQLMKLAISRKREFLADSSGALLTRYPDGLARALEKISKDPHPMTKASNATAHMFISNPFRGKETASWLSKMFMTHPPAEERISKLKEMSL
ncbi:MAG: M48 family metalloprotease [Candidatus Pacebacteria bacterium]|nr:M48 family metalloprotease [Candidatus Paceibacterota bacterium]